MHHLRRDALGRRHPLPRARASRSGPDAALVLLPGPGLLPHGRKGKALEAIEKSAALEPRQPDDARQARGVPRPGGQVLAGPRGPEARAADRTRRSPASTSRSASCTSASSRSTNARAALERALAERPATTSPSCRASPRRAPRRATTPPPARYYQQPPRPRPPRRRRTSWASARPSSASARTRRRSPRSTSAAAANPELAEAHFHLARAYRAVGRAEDSQRELKTFQALKANPLQPFAERSEFERDLWRRAEALVRGREGEGGARSCWPAATCPGNQPEYLVGALYYKLRPLRRTPSASCRARCERRPEAAEAPRLPRPRPPRAGPRWRRPRRRSRRRPSRTRASRSS